VVIHVVEDSFGHFAGCVQRGCIQVVRRRLRLKSSTLRLFAGSGGSFFHQFAQEGNARRTGSVQFAAVRPPQRRRCVLIKRLAGVEIRLAVGNVTAGDYAEPEAPGHLLAGEVAPAAVQIAFILNFVEAYWLLPCLQPIFRRFKFRGLQARMRHPRMGVVVHHVRIVDGPQVACWVVLLYDVKEAVEVLHGFRSHEVPLIRKGPPDVTVRRQPRQHITQIEIVHVCGHRCVSPSVVRMKQDEVCFDPHFAQIGDALLDVGEERGVRPCEVTLARRVALEGIERGLVVVVLIALGKDAHANFVEGRGAQSFKRLLL